MDPPYAFIGSDDYVGIGFRTVMLDLSDGSTPPDMLAQFGSDDSWTGRSGAVDPQPTCATSFFCNAQGRSRSAQNVVGLSPRARECPMRRRDVITLIGAQRYGRSRRARQRLVGS